MAYWLVNQQFAVRPELWPQNCICFTMILSIVVHVAQVLWHHCQSQRNYVTPRQCHHAFMLTM